MSQWRRIEKELIAAAIHGPKAHIMEKNVAAGLVHGTFYFRPDCNRNRGLVLVNGIGGNRYGLGTLAKRLAYYGFFCLSIDPPSHYLNPSHLSLGVYSETVTQAVIVMKKEGVRRVGVIGYSMGAIAALFSMVGYTAEIENRIYRLWEQLIELIRRSAIASERGLPIQEPILNELESVFVEIKQMVLYSLKKGIAENSSVSAYVFLELEGNAKQFIPGISCLRKLPFSWTKKLIEAVLHNPSVKVAYKEGNPLRYEERKLEPNEARWLFLTTKQLPELLEYMSRMKEPKDFLKLVEDLSEFKNWGDAESFFGYYQKKYIWNKPKLFVYGKLDAFLRPFLPGNRSRLEKYYKSCGNAVIVQGDFNHMISDQHVGLLTITAEAATHEPTTELILRFLGNNM
ncbi:hypothetical protein HYU17_05860 [Candidatus Woesearchaeota archaeon]|nr:hypothetical protein [Candidatus Woesearchaeota archaeon]